MKLMGSMMKDEKITSTIEAIETFSGTMINFMSVTTGEYDGGDFCAGLFFGKDGASMLSKLAHSMVDESEEAAAIID